MPLVVGDLEPRALERWRVEIAETLAAQLAYPPYFDHRAGKEIARPVDRAKREEIEQFARSMNFSALDHTDVNSPEVRRFLEQVLRRYLEVNPDLHRPHSMRRLPSLRGRVPRVAAEIHTGLQGFVAGTAKAFGARRPQRSWSGTDARAQRPSELLEHNTRVLETVLARREHEPVVAAPPHPSRQPAVAPPARAKGAGPLGRWLPGAAQPPRPGPGSGSLPGGSPFASLGTGAQSAIFGDTSITDRPTGAMPTPGWGAPAGAQAGYAAPPIPEEIFQLYGDYLHDMQPEAYDGPDAAQAPSATLKPNGGAYANDALETGPMPQPPLARGASPARPDAPQPADPRGDLLIFFQLRYQLEAYVRRAARSYGIQTRSDDPSGVIDALRRSGFVDESDLQLAEGILAVTDRVTAGGAATVEDFRKALMLYLLYHRSHLG